MATVVDVCLGVLGGAGEDVVLDFARFVVG